MKYGDVNCNSDVLGRPPVGMMAMVLQPRLEPDQMMAFMSHAGVAAWISLQSRSIISSSAYVCRVEETYRHTPVKKKAKSCISRRP